MMNSPVNEMTLVDDKTERNGRRWLHALIAITAALGWGAAGCANTVDDDQASPSDPAEPSATPHDQEITCGSSELHLVVHDQCAPMEAQAVGDEYGHCQCFLGFLWDGSNCVGLGDCACVGADCDKLAATKEACLDGHASCNAVSQPLSCGSTELFINQHDECTAMDAQAQGECYCSLGYTWNGSECTHLGGCECVGSDCDKLTQLLGDCQAAHANCTPISGSGGAIACGSPALFDNPQQGCAAMDAQGDGDCHCLLGYAFSGFECVELTGCQCIGTDCDQLTATEQECEAAHPVCN